VELSVQNFRKETPTQGALLADDPGAWVGAARAARMDLALEFQDNMYFDAMYKAVSPDYLALDRSNMYRQFIRLVSPCGSPPWRQTTVTAVTKEQA